LIDAKGRIVDENHPGRYIAHGPIWTTCGRSDWLTGTTVADRGLFGEHHDPWASAVEDRKLLVACWTLVHQAGIAETRVDIPETSVSDAVMLMDLRNTSALMFKNSASGDLNMIYRREDGNIGWVEPRDN
jgi:hypothetical protein